MPPEEERAERYVFDACALIAYLNDEVGAKVVEDLLALATQERVQCFVAAVNVYELFYDCLKRDAATAHQLVDDIYRLPITVIQVAPPTGSWPTSVAWKACRWWWRERWSDRRSHRRFGAQRRYLTAYNRWKRWTTVTGVTCLEVNLTSAFRLTKACLPHMKERGSSYVTGQTIIVDRWCNPAGEWGADDGSESAGA